MKKLNEVLARRQEADRQERRDRILNAGRKVFFKKSYLGATIRDIALEAELSPGLIYHYFKGKDEIYGSICQEAFHRLLDMLKKAKDIPGTPNEKLINIGTAYVRFYSDYPEYFDIISFKELGFKKVGLSDEIIQRLDELSYQSLSITNDIVCKGMEMGAISRDVDAWKVTFALWAAIEGIIFIHKRGYLETFNIDLEELIALQFRIVTKGAMDG
jgi:AcrR family transcriptional regulator